MVNNKLTRTVLLRTYKKDSEGIGIDGESIAVKLPVNWVKEQIAPVELIDFLGDYTYDETEELIDKAERQGIEVYQVD